MKPVSRAICVSMAVVVLLACSLITPTMARYSNIDSITAVYGNTGSYLTGQTLTADAEIYDFGVYTRDSDASAFTHTVCVADTAPVSGVLRFSWDTATRSYKDVTVHVDHEHYTDVLNSGYVDYTVSTSGNRLEIPFSLLFSTVSVTRVAELTVSWYPDGGDEPTLFARYLLALVSEDGSGSAPSFVTENTAYITDRLLQVEITTPDDSAGVWISPVGDVFPAGSRYCSTVYPDGVTLLRDSAIFIERTAAVARLYVEAPAVDALRGATSEMQYSDFTSLRSSSVTALTVSLSNNAGILSATAPLTVTLTEGVSFRDGNWGQRGDTVDLTWQILRRVGNSLQPVTAGESLAVAVAQTADGGTLTLTADGDQPAGTYLLVVTQYHDDYSVLKTPIWFFIDYR